MKTNTQSKQTNANQSLIKSAERVREHGEVFTPDFIVERMLDLFPPDAWEPNKNWMEMTCGNGQFILGILRRKIAANIERMKPFDSLMNALNTTFGLDIMEDNIHECRMRIYDEIVLPFWREHKVYGKRRANQRWQVACVVISNIRHTEDSLKEDFGKFQYLGDVEKEKRDSFIDRVRDLFDLIENKGKMPAACGKICEELVVLMQAPIRKQTIT